MTAQISRRSFLKRGCITTAAVGITLVGGTALAATYQPSIDTPSTTIGDENTSSRVLVTYATKAGSTAEVAARMGDIISKNNRAVEVLPIVKVADLSRYSSVIVGSAIRTGHLLPEAMNFIEKNQTALRQKPFNVFILCMTLEKDNPETRKTVSDYLDPVRALVKPASEGLFAGVMDLRKLPLIERLIIKAMKAPEGDFRKWDLINAWAQNAPLA